MDELKICSSTFGLNVTVRARFAGLGEIGMKSVSQPKRASSRDRTVPTRVVRRRRGLLGICLLLAVGTEGTCATIGAILWIRSRLLVLKRTRLYHGRYSMLEIIHRFCVLKICRHFEVLWNPCRYPW